MAAERTAGMPGRQRSPRANKAEPYKKSYKTMDANPTGTVAASLRTSAPGTDQLLQLLVRVNAVPIFRFASRSRQEARSTTSTGSTP